MYIIELAVNCLENRQNYRSCPQELHSHKVLFDIYLDSASVENEEEILDKIAVTFADPNIFLESSWSVKSLAEEMMKDLINSEFVVKKVKAKLAELPISYEIENIETSN